MSVEGECLLCEDIAAGDETEPEDNCPRSQRPCGHHCNHLLTHDECDWCGGKYVGEGSWLPGDAA